MCFTSTLLDFAKADIFNGKNLVVWKRRMDTLLHCDGLTYVIESDLISKPTGDGLNEDRDV